MILSNFFITPRFMGWLCIVSICGGCACASSAPPVSIIQLDASAPQATTASIMSIPYGDSPSQLGYSPPNESRGEYPQGFDFDADGTLTLVDQNKNRVVAIEPGSSELSVIGSDPMITDQRAVISDVATTSDGSLWAMAIYAGWLFRWNGTEWVPAQQAPGPWLGFSGDGKATGNGMIIQGWSPLGAPLPGSNLRPSVETLSTATDITRVTVVAEPEPVVITAPDGFNVSGYFGVAVDDDTIVALELNSQSSSVPGQTRIVRLRDSKIVAEVQAPSPEINELLDVKSTVQFNEATGNVAVRINTSGAFTIKEFQIP